MNEKEISSFDIFDIAVYVLAIYIKLNKKLFECNVALMLMGMVFMMMDMKLKMFLNSKLFVH